MPSIIEIYLNFAREIFSHCQLGSRELHYRDIFRRSSVYKSSYIFPNFFVVAYEFVLILSYQIRQIDEPSRDHSLNQSDEKKMREKRIFMCFFFPNFYDEKQRVIVIVIVLRLIVVRSTQEPCEPCDRGPVIGPIFLYSYKSEFIGVLCYFAYFFCPYINFVKN